MRDSSRRIRVRRVPRCAGGLVVPTRRSGRASPTKARREEIGGRGPERVGMNSARPVYGRGEGGRGSKKKCLTYSHIGMYCRTYGTSGDNFGCFQCGGRATPARDFELHRAPGTAGGRDCGLAGDGAAVGIEALACVAASRPRQCTTGRAANVLSHERGGHPADARVDGNVRTILASSIKPGQGTCRAQKRSVKRYRAGFDSKEEG